VVTALNVPKGAPEAVALLKEMKDENEALDLWRRLLRVKGASDELVKVMPKTGLPVVMAKTGLRAAREGGRNEAPLILALSSGADLDEEAKMLSPEEMKQLATRVMQRGNPAQGEMVYRRLELACTHCHSIGGVGGKVGPDLTSIGASAPVDYLIESLLYPNRKIKEGYHTVVVETRDDEEYAGILVRESSDELFLLDASNQEMAIPKNNVAARRSGNSLMPAGLLDTMGNQDRLDLFRFMAELGKPGPFDATQGTVARFWRLSPGTIDLAQFGDDKILQSDLKGRDWMTAAATVDGRLLEKDFKAALAMKSWRGPKAIYAAARFELAKPGRVRLGIDLPPGAQAWIGAQSLKLEGDHALAPELPAGVHTVIIKVDVEKMPQHIRLTVDQGTFLVD
jgi:putative heme-binding domain-containing protein